jgi:hypothetical protein
MKQDTDTAEVAARLAKIQRLCDELDRAPEASAKQRALIEMWREADAICRVLSKNE